MRRKKTTGQYAKEKRWVFSFDLKGECEDECLTGRGRERSQVQCIERISPQGPPAHPRNTITINCRLRHCLLVIMQILKETTAHRNVLRNLQVN